LEEEQRERDAEKKAAEAQIQREKEAAEVKQREKEELETKRREKEARDSLFTGKKKHPHMIFFDMERPRIMRENPGISPSQISRIMAEKWRSLTPEEQSKFTQENAVKARESELKGLFGGKKRRKTHKRSKKSSKKHAVRRRKATRKH